MQINVDTLGDSSSERATEVEPSNLFGRFAPLFALVPIAIAAALMFWKLNDSPLWLDEAYSIRFARLSWPELWQATQHLDAVFLPYYSLLHIWSDGQPTVLSGRVFSAVGALPTLPLVFAIGSKLFDRPTGFVASMLVATSFLFLSEAREVRMYGLLVSVETASWLLLLLALEKPTVMRFAGYGALVALSFWLHPLATFNAAAQAVAIAATTRDRRATYAFASLAVACALAVPLAIFALRGAGTGQLDWNTARPRIADLWIAMQDGAGNSFSAILGVVLLVAAMTLAIVRGNRPVRFAIAWFLCPLALTLVTTYAVHPVLIVRYVIEVVPAASLLIAWLICNIRTVTFRVAVAALLAITSVQALPRLTSPAMDWNRVGAVLRAEARAGDPALLYPANMLAVYRVARERDLQTAPPLSIVYPPADTPVWADFRLNRAVGLRPGYRQIWLIGQPNWTQQGSRSLEAHYRKVETIPVRGLVFERYGPR